MFGKLFSKKTKIEILEKEYKKLLDESYKLSTVSRIQSQQKMVEAQAKLDEIERLEKINKA